MAIVMLLTACKKEFSAAPPIQDSNETPEKCIDEALFIDDVTIPDHTHLEPGEVFTKTWRVKNTGTCVWTEDYQLVFALNLKMGAPDSVPLENTSPGGELEISVELTARDEYGSYRADFQLLDPDDEVVIINNGQYLWVIITVSPNR